MKCTAKNVTLLAKVLHASHLMMNPQLRLRWPRIDSDWLQATPEEQADYRAEARQLLRALEEKT